VVTVVWQTEIHRPMAEPLVSEPVVLRLRMLLEMYKSLGTDKIPVEMIRAVHYVLRSTNLLV
jgi:hypothetical protein